MIYRRFILAKNNFERMKALDWLRILIAGGATVPNSVFTDLCQILRDSDASSPGMGSPGQGKSPDSFYRSSNTLTNVSVYVRILQMIWSNTKHSDSETREIANILTTINEANYNQICQVFQDCEANTTPELYSQQFLDSEINTISIFVKYNLVLILHILGCPYDKIEAAEILPVNSELCFHHGNSASAPDTGANSLDSDKAFEVEKVKEIMTYIASYSEHSKLNIHVELIKTLYLITSHDFEDETGLTSKELLHSKLLKIIWELMSPNYDFLAEFSLSVFMRTIKLYPEEFHEFIEGIFTSEDWETRYKNLDNGFGIFFKTTRDFETLHRDSLHLLGPVYNYCVASLWDKNQNVSNKGLTIARSMRSTNQQNALKAWEMYFAEEKSVAEKTKIVQYMTRLNAIFPGLQVFDWEPLTFTLLKYDTSAADKAQRRSSGLPPTRSHPPGNTSSKNGNRIEISAPAGKTPLGDIENLKASLMTLALQMLANSVKISSSELVRLKSAVVIHLGFEDCKIDWQAPKNKEVTFGALPHTADWNSHILLNVFVLGIKRVLDNVPLPKKPHRKHEESSNGPIVSGITASIGPEMLSQSKYHESHTLTEDGDNSADNMVPGTWFVDVILKMFLSCNELYALPTVMLKSWLELMLIIVNKYELDETVIPVMRRITEIVSIDINDENKQLAIAVCYSLLKKPGKLSALLLSKQIIAMGKLLCKARDSPQDIAALKAKEFLREAFYKFADNCLFLLLFKNHGANTSGENTFDLFYVMETVMGPNDVWTSEETEESLPLRDLPIRDVMEHLISQELNGRAFSTVLSNFSTYIIQIHHHSLGDRLLKGIGIFLGKLAGLLDKRQDIDVSPVLDMVEKILREHPFAIATLTPSLKTLVKHAIESSSVNVESLARLLTVHNLIMLDQLANKFSIGGFLVDLMKLIYTGKTKLPTNGAATLVQVMLWDYYAATPGSAPANLALNQMPQAPATNGYRTIFPGITEMFDDMVLFLGDPLKFQKYTGEEFKISIWTSHLIISMLEPRRNRFHELLCKQHNDQNLHLLNHIFLAIAHIGSPKLCTLALELQDTVTEIISHGVKLAASPETNDELYAAQRVVISQTFVLIKAWSILVHILNADAKYSTAIGRSGKRRAPTTMTAERKLWNTIWPMLRKSLVARVHSNNSNELPLVWRHFFQLVAFLQGLGSEILLVYNHDWLSMVEMFFEEEKSNVAAREIENQTKLLLDIVPTIHFSSELESIVEDIYSELRQSSHFQISPEANQLAIFFGQL
ncbi:hypothetical protein K493DRAFT_64806 [Basidiobolus meristosporus CBS 931.73]|uniref:Uncharacterized protein n=1 Tax=Basidiobolus meristosporus CBS 931.73 TaxID=1314790 RepID=A0A1Y1XVP7_9FUNG|nr:hypothetical protein K493DRAFT_64806 [Basidiobolus meristosporus CBS 931.73]|eukprot:ORX89827.1 hypothetical protein K493DRAFT_64806 [Basidiobolus meristosporus CBS 931.73]